MRIRDVIYFLLVFFPILYRVIFGSTFISSIIVKAGLILVMLGVAFDQQLRRDKESKGKAWPPKKFVLAIALIFVVDLISFIIRNV